MRGRLVVGLVLLLALSSACGGSDNDGDEGGSTGETPVPADLVIVGRNELFDPPVLTASSGTLVVRFDNQDDGILHNVRFYRGENADGQFVRKTDIKRGPRTDTIKLNLEPGSYFYDCEVHPATMTGTLTVR